MLQWLRLVRFSGLCTIASNTLATVAVAYYPSGLDLWGLAAQLKDNGMNVLWVCLSSILMYITGMLWNDFVDAERDIELNPQRPLPSGRLSYRTVAVAAMVLPVLTLLSAAMLGERGFFMAGIVLIGIMLYNTLTKNIPYLGSLVMAFIRLSHALFAMLYLGNDVFDRVLLSFFGIGSHVVDNGILSVYPLLLFTYIFGLTLISELESRRGTRLELLIGGSIIALAFLACVYKLIFSHWVVSLLGEHRLGLAVLSMAILSVCVIMIVRRLAIPWWTALQEARHDLIPPVVIKGLGGIILFDAIIAASHHPVLGLLCLLLFPLFLLCTRLTAMD